MFMYKTNRFFAPVRLGCFLLAMTAVFLLSAGLPLTIGAHAIQSTQGWTSSMSGDICAPAGDGFLPAALGGVSAHGAVLLEAGSGDVIFGQNQRTRMPMASTTKIMTALVALEELPLETVVTVTADAVGVEGSSIYLAEGEKLTMEDLLYALLLESANDAAAAIAIAVAGSVTDFAELMNGKAAELGLTDTHFVNPHGLDHEEHYTTAYELAMITRAALENPVFREICSTERRTIPLHGTEGVRLLLNHNKLLDSYEGCIGVKTGFTKKTGRCLVSAAERDGVTLIAVTLNAPDDWRDHAAMLDYGFARYESVPLCGKGFFLAPLWTVSGTQEYVMAENSEELSVVMRRDHGEIFCVVELPRFEFAPIEQGQVLGRLVFFEKCPGGERRELGTVPLHAAYTVEEVTYPPTLWERITGLFS